VESCKPAGALRLDNRFQLFFRRWKTLTCLRVLNVTTTTVTRWPGMATKPVAGHCPPGVFHRTRGGGKNVYREPAVRCRGRTRRGWAARWTPLRLCACPTWATRYHDIRVPLPVILKMLKRLDLRHRLRHRPWARAAGGLSLAEGLSKLLDLTHHALTRRVCGAQATVGPRFAVTMGSVQDPFY